MAGFESRSRPPHIRILGADTTGKTALCNAVTKLAPEFVAFASTDPYVYSWLHTHNIDSSSTITSDQVPIRAQIFLAANRVQMGAIREVTTAGHPVVAVRGRADTVITHGVLREEKLSRSMKRLFSEPYMRPDALVVLTAPIEIIESRLDTRGQAKTGANSLSFHEECQKLYIETGNLASRTFPVLVFDTSNPNYTPEVIADNVLGLVT